MISARKLAVAVAALAVTAGLAGCGETEQVIVYEQGKYQGKPDTRPWENEPGASLYTTSKWAKGDKSSWESALRSRSQNQNEYVRIGD
ncbi:MAG: hypothetical protein A3F75_00980 [Betaproteobacteria bacterium RIFCSPLOWO2_12_FULL_64_23]|nr:MAG: hypothetical protein A3F75_00980 [Betaproteobacteria bacterium RIFCSPLOWO2_12_FULL_64_23]